MDVDYSDTTVIIPVKDEPAVGRVARAALKSLSNCRAIVIYKGELKMRLRHRNLAVVKQVGSGKGVAMRQAVRLVRTPILCFIDGDGTYDVEDLKKVVAQVRRGADMALGNRLHNISEKAMPRYIQLGNRMLTLTANLLYGLRIGDSQTGLRAMRKSVFDALGTKETHFGIEEEMNIKAKKKRLKIVETPIHYYVRVGESKQFKAVDGFRLFGINLKFIFQ